ncbi:MAG: acyltransferase family protein [Marinibacterium sp.]|nr:acyltransferase family protein [Marinibacterium sp.]
MSHSIQRDAGLDIARGIAILLVVVGHVYPAPISSVIYVFHMPFFFLMGGYFFRVQDDLPALMRRFRQLIIPYVVFLVLIALPDMMTATLEKGPSVLKWRIERMILGGEKLVTPFTVFWFPTCYFLTATIYNALRRHLTPGAVWGVCVLLWVLATASQLFWPDFWLPWALNVCAIAVPIFHIGAVWGARLFHPSLRALVAMGVLGGGYQLAVLLWGAPAMDMKHGEYGLPLVTLLAAIACSGLLVALSRALGRSDTVTRALGYCGAASMTIMYVHMPARQVLRSYGLGDPALMVLLCIAISLCVHAALSATPTGRRLFLGRTA